METSTGKPSLVTYEDAKDFHGRGEYTIEVPRERHIQAEIDLYKTVLQLLSQRKWTLYLVPGDYGEFITTSRPVVLTGFTNTPAFGSAPNMVSCCGYRRASGRWPPARL